MRDFYGRIRAAVNGNPLDAPQVSRLETKVNGNITTIYTAFTGAPAAGQTEPVCAIWREIITTSGDDSTYSKEITMDTWTNRATAAYVPINDCWKLD